MIAIVYYSVHHRNTAKLLESFTGFPVQLIPAAEFSAERLAGVTVLGLASGIYFNKMAADILQIGRALPPTLPVFVVTTSGVKWNHYSNKPARQLRRRGHPVLGTFNCRGRDTYVLRRWGGIAKNHPREQDFARFAQFMKKIFEEVKDGKS